MVKRISDTLFAVADSSLYAVSTQDCNKGRGGEGRGGEGRGKSGRCERKPPQSVEIALSTSSPVVAVLY